MPKLITFESNVEIRIVCQPDGTPVRGELFYRGSNGSLEAATVGGASANVDFSALGTAAQRTAFRAVVAAMVAAGRAHIGDV